MQHGQSDIFLQLNPNRILYTTTVLFRKIVFTQWCREATNSIWCNKGSLQSMYFLLHAWLDFFIVHNLNGNFLTWKECLVKPCILNKSSLFPPGIGWLITEKDSSNLFHVEVISERKLLGKTPTNVKCFYSSLQRSSTLYICSKKV